MGWKKGGVWGKGKGVGEGLGGGKKFFVGEGQED